MKRLFVVAVSIVSFLAVVISPGSSVTATPKPSCPTVKGVVPSVVPIHVTVKDTKISKKNGSTIGNASVSVPEDSNDNTGDTLTMVTQDGAITCRYPLGTLTPGQDPTSLPYSKPATDCNGICSTSNLTLKTTTSILVSTGYVYAYSTWLRYALTSGEQDPTYTYRAGWWVGSANAKSGTDLTGQVLYFALPGNGTVITWQPLSWTYPSGCTVKTWKLGLNVGIFEGSITGGDCVYKDQYGPAIYGPKGFAPGWYGSKDFTTVIPMDGGATWKYDKNGYYDQLTDIYTYCYPDWLC